MLHNVGSNSGQADNLSRDEIVVISIPTVARIKGDGSISRRKLGNGIELGPNMSGI